MTDAEHCACCGAVIPEGRQTCSACEAAWDQFNSPESGKRKINGRKIKMEMLRGAADCAGALAAFGVLILFTAAISCGRQTPQNPAGECLTHAADGALTGERALKMIAAAEKGGEGTPELYRMQSPCGWSATETELREVAALVWLEARGESRECQRAIAEVIFNRLHSGLWGSTLPDVIYAAGQFEPAESIPTALGAFDDTTIEMVWDVFWNGCSLSERIMWFRADHYHRWTGAVDEFYLDHTYFSSTTWANERKG